MWPDWIILFLLVGILQYILLNCLNYQRYSYTIFSKFSLLSFYCLRVSTATFAFFIADIACGSLFSFFFDQFCDRFFSFIHLSKKATFIFIFSIIWSLFYWFSVLPLLLFPFSYFWLKLFFLLYLFKVKFRTLISKLFFFFPNINI